MTYKERVRAIAERMAIHHFEKHISASDYPVDRWDRMTITEKEVWIIAEIDRSRIAVVETADAIRVFSAIHGACTMGKTEAYLKEHGLIPNEKE